ncbi:MAG: type II secretion system protein [Candidatus Gracilibacteria bacterium]|jgi:prepilin-type N-terminal cleavage/methylation domain-containing protein
MKNLQKNPRAFTLIELLIVMTIMAFLSVALAVSFSGANQKAAFDDQKLQLINLIQTARSRSFSNVLSEDGRPTEYYLLIIMPTFAAVEAHYSDTESDFEVLDKFTYGSGYEASGSAAGPELMKVYYTPPNGEVCFGSSCPATSDVTPEQTITFRNKAHTLSTTITVDLYGGFADVE